MNSGQSMSVLAMTMEDIDMAADWKIYHYKTYISAIGKEGFSE